jgi:hypothetical protein
LSMVGTLWILGGEHLHFVEKRGDDDRFGAEEKGSAASGV